MSDRQAMSNLHLLLPLIAAAMLSALYFSGCQVTNPERTPAPDHTATLLALPTRTPTPAPEPTASPTQTATANCISMGGELTSDHFYSDQMESDFFFEIYLPPCYDPAGGQSYPVVYLLHGLSYTSDQWPRLGLVETMDALIAAREISPFIVVMPLEASFTSPTASHFGDALIADLIPWVDSHYNTLADKNHRAIGGVSRGAAWAVHLGFENVDLFTKVGAHSLPLFETDETWLLGWVTQTPVEDIPGFFIDIGRDDQEWATALAFADLLDEHSIPHEWYFYTGGHTETYWSTHLVQYLTWYAQGW